MSLNTQGVYVSEGLVAEGSVFFGTQTETIGLFLAEYLYNPDSGTQSEEDLQTTIGQVDWMVRSKYGQSGAAFEKVGTSTGPFDSANPPQVQFKIEDYFGPNAPSSEYEVRVVRIAVTPTSSPEVIRFTIQIGSEIPQSLTERAVYIPFVATITEVSNNTITINQSWTDFVNKVNPEDENKSPSSTFNNPYIRSKINDKRDLNTFLHFGDDNMLLTTNVKTDDVTIPNSPYSAVYKLYEPLPDDIEEKDSVYIVREILPQLTETVELIPYDQEDEDVLILRVPESSNVDSPVTNRQTELQNYNDLLTDDARLKKDIEDKFVSGSESPVALNVDYENYENFINFSSAHKRLKNFKYKLQQIETYTAESASLVGVTNSESDLLKSDNNIREVKNNFDGYENFLYNVSSSYTTSSLGERFNSSWPKTGSGTYAIPFEPVSSSHSDFTNWYGSLYNKTGQIYSASRYDIDNPNRLVNLLPVHVREDVNNTQFLDFMDMIGQQFDELWLYTKSIVDITDRQNDLSKGFSKDLIFNLAKSLGWSTNDGKDLLELSRIGFGQKLSGTTYSLYTSGSIDSPPEGDISKEIVKRLIASMPYILKSKGTLGSLKAIISCYGIPSSILRVREYGGLQKDNQKAPFEIARKFTKALGFRSSQYVETTWADDTNSSRKPDTVEFRFRTPTGSNQILLQKGTEWAIRLKDNDSDDNYGAVSFMLSGSSGYKEITSSQMPVYDGEYHSVMLRKTKINRNLFPFPSFETASLYNPPFITGSNSAENGAIEIVSSSNVSKIGTKSLRHKNTSQNATSYTYFYRNPDSGYGSQTASVTSVSPGDTYKFTAYAKVSSSGVDSVASINLFELDSNEKIVNWTEEFPYSTHDGGIGSSERVGLNETEWKQVQVEKTIKFPNTTKLGIRFENNKPGSTIFWDDVSLRKTATNTDSISDAFSYDLFVKKYDAGLDRILLSSKSNLMITGSGTVTSSFNASFTSSGNLYIGGHSTGVGSTVFNASRFSGSMMEFRLWTEPLKEEFFDLHVGNPKSYVGNTPSSSYYHLVRRYSFDDNSTLATGASIRDTSANQTYTQTGSAQGFGGLNTFESVIDRTKTIIPNHGPNRRMATKIRIENNVLSGSAAGLSIDKRFDFSANDLSPLDSPKLGIYFSPTDVVNEDIITSFANLDFNQYLGDPRDNFEENYLELKNIANQYFQKYDGRNNFWDYMHLIKYYDQSVFKQLKKLVPARANSHMGTLIEGNIFERPKSPVQRNNPSFTQPVYNDTINVGILEIEHEESASVITIGTEYPNYSGTIDEDDIFKKPSLYNFSANDNYADRNLYVEGTASYGGPNYVFSEPTGAMAIQSRLSLINKIYKFHYSSSDDYLGSIRRSSDAFENLYSSKSLHDTDLDPEYDKITALNRSFYEGVKNNRATTLDGDDSIIIRVSSPTVAVPIDATDSNLNIMDTE